MHHGEVEHERHDAGGQFGHAFGAADGEQLSDQFHFKASDQQVDRTVFAQQGRQVNGKADQVGEAGGKGGAGNAPFKGEYEEQVEHDIG